MLQKENTNEVLSMTDLILIRDKILFQKQLFAPEVLDCVNSLRGKKKKSRKRLSISLH